MKCQQTFCPHKATSEIILELRVHPNHPPALSSTIVALCDDHALAVTWSDIMPDESFQVICDNFSKSGWAPPVKQHSNISIRPIADEPENNHNPLS